MCNVGVTLVSEREGGVSTVGMSMAIYSFASLQFTIAPVLSSSRARHILPLPVDRDGGGG